MTTGIAGPRSGRVVGILLCVVPLSQIPLDIYTPAMPDMVADLASTSTAVQATVTASWWVSQWVSSPSGCWPTPGDGSGF